MKKGGILPQQGLHRQTLRHIPRLSQVPYRSPLSLRYIIIPRMTRENTAWWGKGLLGACVRCGICWAVTVLGVLSGLQATLSSRQQLARVSQWMGQVMFLPSGCHGLWFLCSEWVLPERSSDSRWSLRQSMFVLCPCLIITNKKYVEREVGRGTGINWKESLYQKEISEPRDLHTYNTQPSL